MDKLPFPFDSKVIHKPSRRVAVVLGYDARVALKLELRWEKTGLKDYLPAAEFKSLDGGLAKRKINPSGWVSVPAQEAAELRKRDAWRTRSSWRKSIRG